MVVLPARAIHKPYFTAAFKAEHDHQLSKVIPPGSRCCRDWEQGLTEPITRH